MHANGIYIFTVEGGNSARFKTVASLACHLRFQNQPIFFKNGILEYDSGDICLGEGSGESAGPLHVFPF